MFSCIIIIHPLPSAFPLPQHTPKKCGQKKVKKSWIWVDSFCGSWCMGRRGKSWSNSRNKKRKGCKYCYGEKSKNIVERAKLKTETNFVTESKKRTLKCRLSLTKSQTCTKQNFQKGSNEKARSYVLLR